MNNALKLVNQIKEAIEDKKGREIVVLDIQSVSLIADYFILASGNSAIQVKAIAENIEENLEKGSIRVLRKEGLNEGKWVLLDYGDVIVHVFQEEERRFYNLERLWGDAQTLTETALGESL